MILLLLLLFVQTDLILTEYISKMACLTKMQTHRRSSLSIILTFSCNLVPIWFQYYWQVPSLWVFFAHSHWESAAHTYTHALTAAQMWSAGVWICSPHWAVLQRCPVSCHTWVILQYINERGREEREGNNIAATLKKRKETAGSQCWILIHFLLLNCTVLQSCITQQNTMHMHVNHVIHFVYCIPFLIVTHTCAENKNVFLISLIETLLSCTIRSCFLGLFLMLLDGVITFKRIRPVFVMTAGFSQCSDSPVCFLWFAQSAHLELIDALMAVGAMETVSTVLASGGSELLGTDATWDRALLYWVNAVSLVKNHTYT